MWDLLKGEGAAIPFIVRGVGEGMSSEDILNDLDQGGIFIRPEIAGKMIDYLQGAVLTGDAYTKQLQMNSLPNVLRLPLTLTDRVKNFFYFTQVEGFNRSTGALEKRDITIASDTLLTKQQALDKASEYAMGVEDSGGLTGAAGKVLSIKQNSAGITTL